MDLSIRITNELKQLTGLRTEQPKAVKLDDDDGNCLIIDFTAVDSMSCSFWEMRLRVESLDGASLDILKSWAKDLCQRITYLLENIGPLECDEEGKQVLLRSNPPDKKPDATKFYEIILHAQADGTLSLRRFRFQNGQEGRTQVEIQTTCEVLCKLVGDLVESIPKAT